VHIDFLPADATAPPARDLLAAMESEMNELYGGLPPGAAADFEPPDGLYLVGFVGKEAVSGGGFKRFTDGIAEIKRMYVVPAARGRGVARALLGALEDAARERGYRVARLDTGPRQAHARALYESAGYVEVPDYNGNPYAAYWGEKPLRPA
jgi:GNAT superfamily N-acetyltransferase